MAFNLSKLAQEEKIDTTRKYTPVDDASLNVSSEPVLIEEEPASQETASNEVVPVKPVAINGSSFYPFLDNLADVPLSTKFHEKIDPLGTGSYIHEGVDFAVAEGTPVYAPEAGIVTIPIEGYDATGNTVILETKYGTFYFGHLSKIEVVDGKVTKGTLLGLSGGKTKKTPAELTTGPHLHVKYVNQNGVSSDPLLLYEVTSVMKGDDIVNIETADTPTWLTWLGIGAGVAAGLLVVGFLTETIQAVCYRKGKSIEDSSPTISKVLFAIARVPGLKHIDWKCCRIDAAIPRKSLFSMLKRLDYSLTECTLGVQDQNGSLVGFEVARLSDVDFVDTIRLKFNNGYTLHAINVEQVSMTSLASTDVPFVFKGFLVSDADEVIRGGCEIGKQFDRTVAISA